MMLATTLAGLAARPATAQTEMTVELGASQVGPPDEMAGESARYGMAGLRFSHYAPAGSGVTASLMLGTAFGQPEGGDFATALLAGALRDRWGSRWTGGLDAQLVGFQIRAPFPYRTFAVEGGPLVSAKLGPVAMTVRGVAGIGRSRVEVWRRLLGLHVVFEDDLWRVGGTGELLMGRGPVRAGLAGGVHHTAGGDYASGGARMVLAGSWGAAEARGDVWDTPAGREVTGGISFAIPLTGWSVRGFFGKSEPDPLTLTEAGSGSAGVLLGLDVYSSERDAPRVYDDAWEVVSRDDAGARIRFAVDAPAGARAVALVGDFTLWDPVAMRRSGGRWVAEARVPEGTHHYGFLVDDEWYLPDGLQDVVPDEWGRQSAILVIEGVS